MLSNLSKNEMMMVKKGYDTYQVMNYPRADQKVIFCHQVLTRLAAGKVTKKVKPEDQDFPSSIMRCSCICRLNPASLKFRTGW